MKNLYRGLLTAISILGLNSLSFGQCFFNAQGVTLNKSPTAVAVGDFNGDGKADVATVSDDAKGTVSILFNNGTGGFLPVASFRVGNSPKSVAVGDFNADGRPDLVTANLSSGTVSVLLNNGSGELSDFFGPASDFKVGTFPKSVVVNDFNNDAKLDLATANESDNTVSVLLGRGNGDFGIATAFSVGSFRYPNSITAGDFNADGRPDLAASNNGNNTVSVLLNDGAGGFEPATSFDTGSFPTSVAAGDLNGDGKIDLATTSSSDNTVSILMNDGSGHFRTATNLRVGRYPESVIIIDLNSDGRPDLATADANDRTISVLVNKGGGSFSLASSFTVGNLPRSIAVGDFNGDGRPDLTTANYFGASVSTLLNNGSASFGVAVSASLFELPYSLASGDFDKDGRLDLVTANLNTNTASVLIGGGFGNFNAPATVSVGSSPSAIVVGDFNADGNPDFATTNISSNSVSIVPGNGMGGFGPAVGYSIPLGATYGLATGDVNKDGSLDLVVTNANAVTLLLNNGLGNFNVASSFGVGSIPRSVILADFDADSKLDIATANSGDNTVTVLPGRGDGTFGLRSIYYNIGEAPFSIVAGDINLDGRPDVAIAGNNSNKVTVLLNGGSSFGLPTNFSVGVNPVSITIGDYNLDGRLDLATANAGSGTASVLIGNGKGGFGNAISLNTGNLPQSIITGDFNGDGKADLATANFSDHSISTFMNCAIPPTTISLTLTTPTYDCTTGLLSLSTTGGNGQPIEYRIAGLRDWSASNVFAVPAYQRSGTTFVLEARQSGQVVGLSFATACQTIPPTTPPITPPTTPTPPTTTGLTLAQPAYDCNTGQLALSTTGGNGQPVEYRIAGLRDWATSNTFAVPSYQRMGTSFTLEARQSGQTVSLPFTSACQSTTTAPPTTPPTGQALSVTALPLNCQTGTLQLTTTGGDGTPIDYKVPGLGNYSPSPTFTVPTYQRTGTSFTLYARQSGREVTSSYMATCPVSARLASPEAGYELQVVVYPNPVSERFTVGVSGATGQAVRFLLTTLSGQTVVDQRAAVVGDAHTETLSLPASGAGLYLLRVSTPTQSQTVKVLRP